MSARRQASRGTRRVELSEKTRAPLSEATIYSTLIALRNFFQWLAGQPGFKSRLNYSDAEYFNPSGIDTAVAKARRERPVPSLEQIHHILQSMPDRNELDLRDRAIVAFTILTGARDGAIASLKLKHVDLEAGVVHQDAREVRTKFAKTITTTFFPVGELPRQIVSDWIRYLEKEKLWGPDDPLFPATELGLSQDRKFQAAGLKRKNWSNATPIRAAFRKACVAAGMAYFNPHSFRHTLVRLGQKRCRTPEEFKAWSQNLGHAEVMTTFSSYGSVPSSRQSEIIGGLGEVDDSEVNDLARKLVILVRCS